MFAGIDRRLGHGQALVIAALDGHGHDARVAQHLVRRRRTSGAREAFAGPRLGADSGSGSQIPTASTSVIATQRLPLPLRVPVPRANLRDPESVSSSSINR